MSNAEETEKKKSWLNHPMINRIDTCLIEQEKLICERERIHI
jgi:hypothetical protein